MTWLKFFLALTVLSVLVNAENNACKRIESYLAADISSECSYNPDVSSDMISIIKRHGYELDLHPVTTNDGYILNMFRISSPDVSVSKYPIFILHGIVIDVESWTAQGNSSLAFNLAQRGYDVWVGTVRGTKDARDHENLVIDDPEFWDFNLDTLAREDVPTQLKYIVKKTQQKVLFIGHSMGTTLPFMFASEYRKKASKLMKGLVALAPIAYLDGLPLVEFAKPGGLALIEFLDLANIKGILYHEDLVHGALIRLCKLLPDICHVMLTTLPGKSRQFPPEDLLLFMSYWPAGVSIYQLKQYLQICDSKRFQKFDYGETQNMKIYGTKEVPAYNLSNIEIPVLLFYGKNDALYRKETLKRLSSEIGNNVKFSTGVPINQNPKYNFNHMDFLYSENIIEFLYKDLFEKIESQFG